MSKVFLEHDEPLNFEKLLHSSRPNYTYTKHQLSIKSNRLKQDNVNQSQKLKRQQQQLQSLSNGFLQKTTEITTGYKDLVQKIQKYSDELNEAFKENESWGQFLNDQVEYAIRKVTKTLNGHRWDLNSVAFFNLIPKLKRLSSFGVIFTPSSKTLANALLEYKHEDTKEGLKKFRQHLLKKWKEYCKLTGREGGKGAFLDSIKFRRF